MLTVENYTSIFTNSDPMCAMYTSVGEIIAYTKIPAHKIVVDKYVMQLVLVCVLNLIIDNYNQ